MIKSLKRSGRASQEEEDDHPTTVEFLQIADQAIPLGPPVVERDGGAEEDDSRPASREGGSSGKDGGYSAFLEYLGTSTDEEVIGVESSIERTNDGNVASNGSGCDESTQQSNGRAHNQGTSLLGLQRIPEAKYEDGNDDDFSANNADGRPAQSILDGDDSDDYAHAPYSGRPSLLTRESSMSSTDGQNNAIPGNKKKKSRRLSGFLEGERSGGDDGGGGRGVSSRKSSLDEEPGYDVRAAFEKEHKAVRKFKVVVVLVLVAAAIAVSVFVYKFTSGGEKKNLETEYNDYAAKFITNFHHLQVMRQWASYTVASMFTAKCVDRYRDEVCPWPNITLPVFSEQVRGAIVLAHATNIEFSPLFLNNGTTREEWEAYAVENEDTVLHVPEWAKKAHSMHATDHGGHQHVGNGGHGHSGEANGHSMADGEFGPDMNSAVQVALTDEEVTPGAGRRHLRGEQHTTNVFDGEDSVHEDQHGAESDKGHESMSHSKPLASSAGSKHGGRGCTGVGEAMGFGETTADGNHIHPRRPIEEGIYTMNGMNMVDEKEDIQYLAPAWHIMPLMGNEGRLLYNEYSDCHRRQAIHTMLSTGGPALTEVLVGAVDMHHYFKEPSSIMFYPVHDRFDEDNKNIVGFVSIVYSWIGTFWNILPENIKGIDAVIETSTGQQTTFRINGKHGNFIGEGDLHERKWDHMKRSSSIYRVYAEENDVKEMVGHHLLRHLEEMGHGHDTDGGHGDASHGTNDNVLGDGNLDYQIHIYPSNDFEACYLTSQPKIFSLAVSLVFLVTVVSFIVYDNLVERRQKKLLQNAERSGKIVSSLFPAMVRERLYSANKDDAEERMNHVRSGPNNDMKRLKKFMAPHQSQQSQSGDSDTMISGSSPPIADLYHDTTVMFADIAGFTAWSSEREPTQVFQLLESLFCEFDSECSRMKVFKIETIGDCYVAVTGLPEPNPAHAVMMAKFAQRCLMRFSELTKELELSLGPGTADLGIRIGLHSGPVTAGVLRGEKARFQLFGDTMNTASRMESTSIKNMIQISADTAALLQSSGKGHILIAREGLIKAKGKGYMQTYWLRPKTSPSSVSSTFSENLDAAQASQHEVDHIHSMAQHDEARAELGLPSFSHRLATADKSLSHAHISLQQQQEFSSWTWNDTGFNDIPKNGRQEGLQRLIKWNTAVLESILTKVIIQRNEQRKRSLFNKSSKHDIQYNEHALFHEEIAVAVDMPRFDCEAMSASCLMPSKEKVNLIPPKAREELKGYVARIASMYNDVHFHSFEHASHVTMSAKKLISKIVERNSAEFGSMTSKQGEEKKDKEEMQRNQDADLFFSTYGISADPLAQFAVVFAALVHDVEHRGVPNLQLIKEKPELANKYKNKSVAENNSIRVAFQELTKPEFSNLRRSIFGSDEDETRFRQLLINVVISTDITDRERRAGERERWEAAFRSDSDYNWEKEWQNKSDGQLPGIDVSLKATVVLEQIVLASDVAHTMQHWLTYVKWNERLYKEMWAAYASGRAEKDPTEGWYKGEIGFFDGYIIPLATKLKECGVFGNAGDEYLGNALRNKAEWIEKGQAIVDEFEAKIKRKSMDEKSVSFRSDSSSSSFITNQ